MLISDICYDIDYSGNYWNRSHYRANVYSLSKGEKSILTIGVMIILLK
jgi:hypothetical protein